MRARASRSHTSLLIALLAVSQLVGTQLIGTQSALADVDVELPNRTTVTGTLAATPAPGAGPPTYRVTLPLGARLSLVAISRSGPRRRTGAKLRLQVLDPQGNDIAAGIGRSRGVRSIVRLRVAESGEHRIRVIGDGGTGGEYTLAVRWRARRRFRFRTVIDGGLAEIPFAADRGQRATIAVRSRGRSAALPRLDAVDAGSAGTVDQFPAPPAPDARIHRVEDIEIPAGGQLLLRLGDAGDGGAVSGTITLRTPDTRATPLDLSDAVLGEAQDGGAVAIGRILASDGGTLEIDGTGRLAGSMITFPDGAIPTPTPVFLGSSDAITTSDPGLIPAGPTILVGPDDTLLGADATLTLPYDTELTGPSRRVIRVLQQSGDASQVLSEDDGIVVDSVRGTVTLAAGRLGRFRVLTLGDPPPTPNDIDGDGFSDLVVRAPNDDTGRGALFIYFGPLTGDRTTETASTVIRGNEIEAYFGFQYVAADLDHDGRSELIVSEEGADFGDGAVHVFANVGRGEELTIANATARFAGTFNSGETFGISLASGDVNNDGAADILIGAENAGSNSSGRAYVFLGDPRVSQPFSGDYMAALADCRIFGASPGDLLGSSVAIADVTGDEIDDIVVAADQALRSATGRIYMFAGPLVATSLLGADATIAIAGQSVDGGFGLPVTTGDADGDGIADLLVGAANQNVVEPELRIGAGRAYLFYGGDALLARGTLTNASSADWAGDGGGEFDGFSQSLCLGDVTGDGVLDVLVGAPYDSARRLEAGSISIFEGSRVRGQIAVAPTSILNGVAVRDTLSWVDPTVDVNGDGRDDLITLAPANSAGGKEAGAAYILFGGLISAGESRVDQAAADGQGRGFIVLGTPGQFLGEASLFFDF